MALYFNEPTQENNPTNLNQKCENLFYYNSPATLANFTLTMGEKTICEGN